MRRLGLAALDPRPQQAHLIERPAQLVVGVDATLRPAGEPPGPLGEDVDRTLAVDRLAAPGVRVERAVAVGLLRDQGQHPLTDVVLAQIAGDLDAEELGGDHQAVAAVGELLGVGVGPGDAVDDPGAAALAVLSLAIAGCQDTGTTESLDALPSISTESMGTESMDMESMDTESMDDSDDGSDEASPSDHS